MAINHQSLQPEHFVKINTIDTRPKLIMKFSSFSKRKQFIFYRFLISEDMKYINTQRKRKNFFAFEIRTRWGAKKKLRRNARDKKIFFFVVVDPQLLKFSDPRCRRRGRSRPAAQRCRPRSGPGPRSRSWRRSRQRRR